MSGGHKDSSGKFHPHTKHIMKSHGEKLTEADLRKEHANFAGVDKWSAKELVNQKKKTNQYDQAEKEMNEYFEGFGDYAKSEVDNAETIKGIEFDQDAYMSPEDGDRKLKVAYIGEAGDIIRDVVGHFNDGEIEGEMFNDFMYNGKGNDIISKNLGAEYDLQVADTGLFLVKELN